MRGTGFWKAATLAAFLLAASAMQPSMASDEALKPLKKIALLRAPLQAAGTADAAYQAPSRFGSQPTTIFLPAQGGNTATYGTAIGASLLVSGVAALVDQQRSQSRQSMNKLLADIGLLPEDLLNTNIGPLLVKNGVEVVPAFIEQTRVDASGMTVSESKPVESDAVLDIRVTEYGFFRSMRAGGYSPLLSVTATLTDPRTGEEIASFDYYSDWRKSPEDPRWFTSDPATVFPDMETLEANLDKARAGFEDTLNKMLAQIAEDVQRRSLGLEAK